MNKLLLEIYCTESRPTERPLLLSRQGPVRHTPVQYEVRTARYNYTRREGTTYAGMLLSRNGTKIGTVHDFSLYRTAPRCSALH